MPEDLLPGIGLSVVAAESVPGALDMYQQGAAYVSLPRVDAARGLANLLLSLDDAAFDAHKEQHIQELKAQREVIP